MKKVILAEDSLLTRKVLLKFLENDEFFTIQCSDGQKAWEVLNDNPDVSLLITDMQMPNMDGRELVTRVRDSEVFKDLPIIMCSGVISLSEITGLLELGASRFIPKPVEKSTLLDYAEKLLGQELDA